MADAKLEVKIGGISFSGEGSEKWLAEQLETILKVAPKLSEIVPPAPGGDGQSTSPPAGGGAFNQTLASYLTAKNVGTNQTKRFLTTADWLRRKGITPLTTAAVSKALKDNHQAKIGNPAQSLNQNVTKGYAEKTTDGFFITPDGVKSISA